MTSQQVRKPSTYRFHDAGRTDRKFLMVALASALILAAVLSGLVFEFLHAGTR